VEYSNQVLSNNTISNNIATNYGGGMFCQGSCEPLLLNCVFWNNSPYEIAYEQVNENCITIAHSDIQGGIEAIYTNNQAGINWMEGNIDADPLFVNAEIGDYFLMEDSPCIDTGIAYYEYEGEIVIDLSEDEYYGIAPDMGACEYDSVEEDDHIIQNSKFKISRILLIQRRILSLNYLLPVMS